LPRTTRATFFTLGWIAERYPQLVRRVLSAGHELASHGYGHLRCTEQNRAELLADVRRAKELLEDVGGQAVLGYRAPSFSIGKDNGWAFDVLLEAGYRYTSSVYPVHHDHYGMPDAPRFPYDARPGLREIPITTTRVLGRNLPAGVGGYFRLLPYRLSRWALQRVNEVDARPAIFYLHPGIDPAQPRSRLASRRAATTSTCKRNRPPGCCAISLGTVDDVWLARVNIGNHVPRGNGRPPIPHLRRAGAVRPHSPQATFFHRIGGAIHGEVFIIGRIYSSPNAANRWSASFRLRR
jgi:polysaccharide deacetylase family protein (PEP-CTERM system associated)